MNNNNRPTRTKCEKMKKFIKTNRNTKYKIIQYKGKRMREHRRVWIQNYGDIPKGYIIHHINENKGDNQIENLKCVTILEHNRIHCCGKPTWNKGKTTHFGNNIFGHNVTKRQINKQKIKMLSKNLNRNIEIWKLRDNGLTPTQISKKLNLTTYQVNHGWKSISKIFDTSSGRLK